MRRGMDDEAWAGSLASLRTRPPSAFKQRRLGVVELLRRRKVVCCGVATRAKQEVEVEAV